jgi:hypothetical protein
LHVVETEAVVRPVVEMLDRLRGFFGLEFFRR